MREPLRSRYRILEKIGSGGMGVVYRAEDVTLGRTVALKMLPEGSLGRADRRARFLREARAAAALNHPRICTVYEVGEFTSDSGAGGDPGGAAWAEGTPFIAMEFVEGRTLRSLLASGPLAVEEALRIARDVADGLACAHAAGIVHRDLKPENIMVGEDGRAKILDFGIAKIPKERGGTVPPEAATLTPTQPVKTTVLGEILGSAAYMSPEQTRGRAVDVRSDVFSFGILLHEMLTGRTPFQGATRAEVMNAILLDRPGPASDQNPAVPPALDAVIARCLQKDRDARYPSAREIRADIERLALPAPPSGTEGGGASTPAPGGAAGASGAETPAARPASASRRWPLVLTGAAAAAVLLVLALRGGAGGLIPWGAPGTIGSIAVLPLADRSGDPDQEYFAEGMTDLLIANLSQISALKVISRTSVMQYRGDPKPLREIARDLDVEGIVEGSVARGGGRVRITAQLVHAATDRNVWARTYERDAGDVLALQGEIARAIAEEIQVTLSPRERARLAGAAAVDPEAQELYLRGRHHWNRRTREDLETARDLLQRAVEKAPEFAAAHAGLADAYNLLGFYVFMPPREAFPRAIAAARKALEIDEALAEAHAALAYAAFSHDWDWAGAEAGYRRSIALNPGYASARQWYALNLAFAGRHEEARSQIDLALDLDPLSLPIGSAAAWIAYFAGDDDRALALCRRTLDRDPGFRLARWVQGLVRLVQGRYSEATAEFSAIGYGPISTAVLERLAAGRPEEALGALEEEIRAAGDAPEPYYLATNYALLGRADDAFRWLEKAIAARDAWILEMKVNRLFAGIRSDARFAELLRQAGIPGDTGGGPAPRPPSPRERGSP
jgi:serine/threonine protein kinase/Tfp pilus assembly protein PilF